MYKTCIRNCYNDLNTRFEFRRGKSDEKVSFALHLASFPPIFRIFVHIWESLGTWLRLIDGVILTICGEWVIDAERVTICGHMGLGPMA